ncbi:MAG: FtsW/RodA/SpoVE family cell cycle protein [Actinomycetota bacterium]
MTTTLRAASRPSRVRAGRSADLSVRERRRAALERVGTRERRHDPGPTAADRRARRAARRDLGPPTGTWYGIVGVVIVFVTLGLVMVLSASAVTQANIGNSPYHVFLRQSMWAGLGLAAMVIVARVPYDAWRRLVIPLGVIGVLAMFGPFAPGIGSSVNGARSWIRVGGFSVQPSEFLKLVLVIATADLLTRRRTIMNHRTRTVYPVAAIAVVGAGLCLLQKDLGSAIVLGAIVLAIAWIAGMPFRPLAAMRKSRAALPHGDGTHRLRSTPHQRASPHRSCRGRAHRGPDCCRGSARPEWLWVSR